MILTARTLTPKLTATPLFAVSLGRLVMRPWHNPSSIFYTKSLFSRKDFDKTIANCQLRRFLVSMSFRLIYTAF